MTALLTDEAVIEAARSHAQEETKLMPDSTERDEHLEYAERDFEAGARFARDHYEARLAEDAKVRKGISLLIWKIDNAQGDIAVEHYSGMLREMLAELDAHEKGEGRG